MKEDQSCPPSAFLKKFVSGYSFEKSGWHQGDTGCVAICIDTVTIRMPAPGKVNEDHRNGYSADSGQHGIKEGHMIIISFKHNASRYFNLPASGEIHFDSERVGTLLGYLPNCTDLLQMTVLTNLLLITFLTEADQSFPYHAITAVANRALQDANPLNIEHLAMEANMSLRNFERRFFELIGVAPKLFCRMVRFNRVVEIKKKNPKEKWTSIAYDCGFCNQTHLSREFKFFAGISPTVFIKGFPYTSRLV